MDKIVEEINNFILQETDIEDIENVSPGMKTEIKAWIKLKERQAQLKKELKSIDVQVKDEEEILAPAIRQLRGGTIKVDKLIISYMEKIKKPRPDYKDLFEVTLSKVNKATKNLMAEMKNDMMELKIKVANASPEDTLKIKHTLENTLQEGIWDKVKGFVGGMVSKWKKLFNIRQDSIEDLEKALEKMERAQ